ncbi:hypothetical protein J8B19_23795 [Vibrio parahaemolyticus]|nr:hypothetical protein [Vibrio parahaemolyticus]
MGNWNSHNKAFKRDSQRLAVSVQGLVYVFMAQWFKSSVSVVHPLTRRYVFWSIYDFTQLLQKLA